MGYRTDIWDIGAAPTKTLWFLKPVESILIPIYCGKKRANTQITKHGFDSFEEPAIIICNHASFFDFGNIAKAMKPYYPGYICSLEEFIGKEWVMRGVSCIPKRKFNNDVSIPMNIYRMIHNLHESCVIFTEARFTMGGINERVDKALGKLAKMCKCRVIVFLQKGNFLISPMWNKRPYRKVQNFVDCYEVASKEEVMKLSADEIQARIEEKFHYDEYAYQRDNKIVIDSKYRAHNIHRILYKCPDCGCEGEMTSEFTKLSCKHCGASWEMNEYGLMIQNGKESRFPLVSDWYRWEREEAYKKVNSGNYKVEDDVLLTECVNSKVGLKDLGKVHFVHDYNGITMTGKLYDGSDFYFNKPVIDTPSIHLDWNMLNRGCALDINNLKITYFAYTDKLSSTILKFNFTVEALHDKLMGESNGK